MEVVELSTLSDLLMLSYESLLAALRLPFDADTHERLADELRSRDRAYHNQWVQACGGELK
jgi:hypothetical protein